MSVITVFNGMFSEAGLVVKRVLDSSGYRLITDQEIVADAANLSGMAESKIARAFQAKASVFNSFNHEKERAVAWLRLAMANKLMDGDGLLFSGFASQLPPADIGHILRICLISGVKDRLAVAAREEGYAEKHAAKIIRKDDEDRAAWVKLLTDTDDPWAKALYDMVIPVGATGVDQSASLILEHLNNDAIAATPASRAKVADFLLAAKVETVLAAEGHNVQVLADAGAVTLTINKHVLMLERLEHELADIVSPVDGVKSVTTAVGKGYHQTDIYRRVDFEIPSKVLLVDDEREFVQTLSERLMMRDMGSAVVYDGESALDMVREDEPEVMILDLKMPGIDGIEVLRRVKKEHPMVEVIILTGHGSEKDRETCMELGAFAYLHKPVDIEILSRTLKAANEKIRAGK
ncbi:MAG: response regulator [Pseudodesulfovibrio sp.]|uniref:Response regulator receiver n=1 Tax=Pseudodesulfovibrio aespoeensis (strain ATCC 700646 / DSM 10631 / Aspo-2) TaxID=643562 RepID=E6VUF0_PSEA9|nr:MULTISPECIES: response regulator [Pseudodesulfovibrio]MBU4193113.1 response regulator [Pseudomonadota bacterium]ADU61095.1 response regulator receiver [Pseudodesulfovibrio aespoeensis Aspo-2]MBU4244113.1 response regulator [Pseudomonadota bacterium]MBU4476474.1 response regulator [Pseudomonadota bacterium]MBU4517468.1 response regulator [Pseudomonadota bacterium]